MKNKIVSIFICMLVTATLFSVTVSAFTTRSSLSEQSLTVTLYERTLDLRNPEVIIELLQQMDESLILGYLQDLVAFGPRVTGSSACEAAGTYLYNEFQSMGLEVRYHHWTSGSYTSRNIEATLPGVDETSDEIYIVCAHYDSVAGSPGADDDGSGVVAAMAAAYLMRQYAFNHTVRFVAFSGEEQGLLGSQRYVTEALGNGDNIVGTLNADMIGFTQYADDGNKVKIYVDTASQWLFTFTSAVNTQFSQYINLNAINSGYTWGSDHNSFWDGGYHALFYHEYRFNTYYHSPQDTIANMNITYSTKVSKLIMATLAALAEPTQLSTPPTAPIIAGPTQGVIDHTYSYTFRATDPDGDNILYYVEWGDGTNSGWVGPYTSGTMITLTHLWTSPGTYEVRAKARDVNYATGAWSDPLTVTILIDTPPNTPTITGTMKGSTGVSYLYKFTTIDPDGDMVYYYIDWGDGSTSDWIGPYASGAEIGVRHQWNEQGTYLIKAKAKDIYGVESDWGTLEVTMPTSLISSSSSSMQLHQNAQIVVKKIS